MLQQMVEAARLDRGFYTRLIFDSYATGNAVLVVALIYLVAALVPLVVVGIPSMGLLSAVLNVVLRGGIGWIVVALVVWGVGAFLLEGDAQLQTVIRLVGFAHAPLALLVLAPFLGALVVLGAAAWFAAATLVASEVVLGLARRRAVIPAGAGVLVWLVLVGPMFL